MEDKFKKEVEIAQLKKEHEDGVIDLILTSFSGKQKAQLLERYRFANYHNPAQNNIPLGLVAIYNKKIISYRGFIGLPYLAGDEKIKILIPNSTATHPDYQRKGISREINEKSLDIFSDQYIFFLGTSLNKLSFLGKLKQKWRLLAEKDYLYKRQFRISSKLSKNKHIFFEDKVPTEAILSISKASIFSKNHRIRIDLSTKDFVNWVFTNQDYKWAVLSDNKEPIAYCCYTVDGNKSQIIHYDMIYNDNNLAVLLNEISRNNGVKLFMRYCPKTKSLRRKILMNSVFFEYQHWLY